MDTKTVPGDVPVPLFLGIPSDLHQALRKKLEHHHVENVIPLERSRV